MLIENPKVKEKSENPPSRLLLHHPTFQSIIFNCHGFNRLIETVISVMFIDIMQQEPQTSLIGFRPQGNSGFAVGYRLTSCLVPSALPQAAVGFRIYDPQGCHSVPSAQAPELGFPHLLFFPVLIGCWVISSANTGQIQL